MFLKIYDNLWYESKHLDVYYFNENIEKSDHELGPTKCPFFFFFLLSVALHNVGYFIYCIEFQFGPLQK